MSQFDIAVVGGGAAGIMAALRGVLNNDNVALFTGNAKAKKKSRAQWVSKVENMPGYHEYKKGIVNPNMETLKWIKSSEFKDKFTQLNNLSVETITRNDDGTFTLKDNKGEEYQTKYVVLATGLMDVQPHIGGSIEPVLPYANVQLIDYCLRCDGHHVLGKDTTIIGHTSGAIWVASMLYERYQTPSMNIVTNGETSDFDETTQELAKMYGFNIYTSPIKSIDGNAKELVLNGFELEDGTFVKNDIAFVSLGMIVYNELAKSLGAEVDNRGFVTTNQKGETTIEGLYAVGDLQADIKKQIYTAWDSAVDALDDINGKIRRKKREARLAEFRGK